MDDLITWHLGPIAATLAKQSLVDDGRLVRATVRPVWTAFSTDLDGSSDYTKIIREMTLDAKRNRLIASTVGGERKFGLRLVLTDRKSHTEKLAALIPGARALHSQIKDREKVIDDARAGRFSVLVATGQLIGEGFDLPAISSVHLATPIKFRGRLLQYLGRALRPSDGKSSAEIYDYVDLAVPVLAASWWSRRKIYDLEPGIEVLL
jgi:superfamily II DNA or RNA helicase